MLLLLPGLLGIIPGWSGSAALAGRNSGHAGSIAGSQLNLEFDDFVPLLFRPVAFRDG